MCQIQRVLSTHSHIMYHKYIPRIVWTQLKGTSTQFQRNTEAVVTITIYSVKVRYARLSITDPDHASLSNVGQSVKACVQPTFCCPLLIFFRVAVGGNIFRLSSILVMFCIQSRQSFTYVSILQLRRHCITQHYSIPFCTLCKVPVPFTLEPLHSRLKIVLSKLGETFFENFE